jgi:hypothetical protein
VRALAQGAPSLSVPYGTEASLHTVPKRKRAHQQHMGVSMRRIVSLALAVGALAIPATAFADPDFGPGNSSKGPNDGGAKCHPPGQTVNEPGCK